MSKIHSNKKDQLHINGREKVGYKILKNPKALNIQEQMKMFMKIYKTIIQHRKRECK